MGEGGNRAGGVTSVLIERRRNPQDPLSSEFHESVVAELRGHAMGS